MVIARRVTAIGDNCVDEFANPIGRRFAGGSAYNVAVQLSSLGFASEYMGAFGDDADGRALRAVLLRERVLAGRIRVLPGHTAVTQVELREGGERFFLHEDLGVVVDYAPSSDDLERAAESDFVHGAVIGDVEAFLVALQSSGARVSYDFSTTNAPPDLRALEVAFFSARPGVAPIELARSALAAGAQAAVVTCGAHGSVAIEDDAIEEVPAVALSPLDTTGAGDAYISAFLAERLERCTLRRCMEAAAELAAKTCLHLGSSPRSELQPEPANSSGDAQVA